MSKIPSASAAQPALIYPANLLFVISVVLAALIFQISQTVHPSKISNKIKAASIPLNMHTTSGVPYPFVFVSRKPRSLGSVYWNVPLDMPGVGAHSRTRTSAPGKLQVCDTSGVITTLIDGSNPASNAFNLIDVNSPNVSYDGTKIIFAGLPQAPIGQPYDTVPNADLGAWRIYVINTNGTGLAQLTFTDLTLNYAQLNPMVAWSKYDDFDPCFLPDGRIVFSSTRFPTIAHYSGVRTSNLYVMDANGNNMHRITSERNGADRPLIDPMTGKIVFARWWRNYRFAKDDTTTIAGTLPGGYLQKGGLTMDRSNTVGPVNDYLFRNAWHAASINPDGTDLKMFAGTYRTDPVNHMYGGAFTPQGDLITNYFPMYNMTEAAGFGGLRKYKRGASSFISLIGVTDTYNNNFVNPANPTSYGIHNGNYAGEPEVLPDGRILFSWCNDVMQDYGIYLMNADGTGKTLVIDIAGKSELRAKLIMQRATPPVIVDAVPPTANQLPPLANGPYNTDGTFIFNALNVYFNAPVDTEIISAPPVGSAGTIKFFTDFQRTSSGSFEELDWPILLSEKVVNADGSVVDSTAPANIPLFEQIRSPQSQGYKVPLSGGSHPNGAAMVEGLNFGKPNAVATCVGCHAGHTMIEIPILADDIKYSNVAPGATITASTYNNIAFNNYVVDRKVLKSEYWQVWTSAFGQTNNQWVKLDFLVPIKIRRVKLYNPINAGAPTNYQITSVKTVLYADAAATIPVDSVTYNQNLSESGTNIFFNDVIAKTVKVFILNQTGLFDGANVSALSEIEIYATADVGNVTTVNEIVTANWKALVFPNPANNYFDLSFTFPEKSEMEILILDLDGRKMLSEKIPYQNTKKYNKRIDSSKYKAGIYFVHLKAKSFYKTMRVIKV